MMKKWILIMGMVIIMAIFVRGQWMDYYEELTDIDLNEKEIIWKNNCQTQCIDGKCTTILGQTFYVNENGNCISREQAKSLKDTPIKLQIILDERYPVTCSDYNWTHRTCTYKISDSEMSNKDIPLSIIERGEEQDIEKSKTNLQFISDKELKEITIEVNANEIIKFGENSTIIRLNDTNGDILEDTRFDEDENNVETDKLIADKIDGTGEIVFVKYNISAIPYGSVITDAHWFAYVALTSYGSTAPVEVCHWTNQTWHQAEIDALCTDVHCQKMNDVVWQYCDSIDEVTGWTGRGASVGWDDMDNFSSAIQNDVDNNRINFSFVINNTDTTDYYNWCPLEDGASCSSATRHYLTVTYDEGEATEDNNITTTLNLFLNDQESDLKIDDDENFYVYYYHDEPDANVTLYRNGTIIDNNSLQDLDIGWYNFTATTNISTEINFNNITYFANVTSSQCNYAGNGNYEINKTCNLTGETYYIDCNISLFQNGSIIGEPTIYLNATDGDDSRGWWHIYLNFEENWENRLNINGSWIFEGY